MSTNIKIFDSHCHLQFPQYDADREEMIARSVAEGVGMICVGTDLETSKQGIELVQTHENMWATAGIHPNAIDELYKLDGLEKLLTQPKVVAVGEVGLDYYRAEQSGKPFDELRVTQLEVFKQFLDLAIQYDKPVVLHARDAGKGSTGKVHTDIFNILSTYSLHDRDINIRGVAHSFTGTTVEAQQYLDLGFYLGFNGIITFARQYDEMIKSVPLDRILLETDAPFLAPESYRGQRNEPAYVLEVARKLAELKNQPFERIIEQTTRNTKHLFGI